MVGGGRTGTDSSLKLVGSRVDCALGFVCVRACVSQLEHTFKRTSDVSYIMVRMCTHGHTYRIVGILMCVRVCVCV